MKYNIIKKLIKISYNLLNNLGRVVGCTVFGLILALTCLVTRHDGFFYELKKISTDIKTMEYTTKSQRPINVGLGITFIWFASMFIKFMTR